MANDELIFRIGFDLEAGVKEAMKDGDLALGKIEKALAKKPIIVKMRLDQQERLSGQVKSESKKAASALSGLKKEMAELNRQWNTLTASERGGEAGAKLMAQYRALSEEAKGYMTTLNAAVKLEDKLARQREKSADAAQKAAQKTREYSDELKNQDGYISRLLKRMAVYAGYSMATNFLTSVRDVTAEFELQRVSLGAIIQDQQRANQLFAEIKSFALTSPLKILDLTKYTKQVAAYGFETEKLFDTTKMLADISVGLGADISRATLFLGQVYATGHLRAAELRQATELGIPLVDKLAKKLEELNGRFYSAADVMDLISKRAISFEMVESVFKDMTSAGGEFYNMQVKQSQTLYGMWSKLGDAAAIMYDQIGNTSTVNAGMKTTMGLLESMMRNWKTTARVLDTVSVALAVYVIGLKNATIASKAVTFAEAQRLAVEKGHLVITPKVIAAIIGKGRALDLSIRLTNLHTAAMAREAAATNVLTRGFWKLTAAMLANPWVAAAAGIALVVTALIHFIGNTETAAERAEKLNNSVASLKNLEDTTKPLIDTYNELINKTERTAEEQKKLSEVTHELAKQYPGAITAIGNFGEEVELAADKLNQLYQAEKQARMENTRHELQETEKQIASTEARIAQLQKYLSEGKMWVGGGGTGGGGGGFVAMSDEERGRILKQIDMLRYGEDGQSGLFGLQQSAEAARRALGLIPSEATQAVEKFGAWKKHLTTFQKQIGNTKIKLFDDSTIAQFGTLEEALDAAAKKYREAAASVEQYNKTLESKELKKASQDQIDRITAERDEAQATKDLSEEMLTFYNAMALVLKAVGGGAPSDNRLQNLQEIERTLTSINKKYEELAKTEGNTAALEYVRENYDSTLKYINKLGEQFNLNFAMPTDFKDLQSYRKAIQGVIEQLKMKGHEKAAIELELKIAEGNQAQLQKEIQAKLKALADRISRTKTAKEFYEKILSQTGDVELAARVSLSIYGSTGKELSEQIKEQFRLAFATLDEPDVEVSAKIGDLIDKGRYEELRDYIALLPEAQRKAAEDLVKAQQQMSVKQYEQWLKDLEKAKDYADKRIELSRYTANQIAAIEERIAKLDPAASDYKQQKAMLEKLIAGYENREKKEAAGLEYEQFKNSALYVQVFENLDNASKTALENMRNRLLALKDQWKNLSPQQVKELTKRLEELDAQIAGRNPFKSIADSIKKLRDMRMGGRTKEGDAQKAFDAEADRQAAEAKMIADEKAYETAVKQYGVESDIAKAKRKIADDSADAYRKAEQTADSAAENADEWEEVAEAIDSANQKLDKYQEQINEALGGVRKIMESFGASAEDMQFFDDVTNGFNEIFDAGQQGAAAYADFMQGNFVGAATKGISAVGSLISGVTNLFYAGRVKRANKEIKRQQELLYQLEYTYGRLEKAADKAFGADYLQNYNQQIRNLQAQQQAYLKQAEAERSKGKKADEEKIREYENQARETADKIADMQNDLASKLLGSDIASTARDFASAWLEAYREFGSVTDAMSKKFKEMIQGMVANSVIAQVMKRALEPTFKLINEMEPSDFYSESFWSNVAAKAEEGAAAGAHGAEVVVRMLEKAGLSFRELGSEYTGIAKDVASASSEEINRAAAIGNTLMYHTAYLPQIYQEIAAWRAASMGSAITPAASDAGAVDNTTLQTQAMNHYKAIEANTAATVVRLDSILSQLSRIVTTRNGRHGVSTFLNSQ